MNRLAASSVFALVASLMAGCLGNVVVDDRGRDSSGNLTHGPSEGGSTGQKDSESDPTEGPSAEGANALLIRYGDISESTDGTSGGSSSSSGGSSTSGGDTTDPNQLMVIVSNQTTSCANPYGYDDSCETTQRLYIPLPVDLQHPGLVNLAQVNAYFSELDGNPDPQICWNGGGGGSVEGTLDIESIDDSGVHGQLTITAPTFDTSFLDVVAPGGALVAARCGAE